MFQVEIGFNKLKKGNKYTVSGEEGWKDWDKIT